MKPSKGLVWIYGVHSVRAVLERRPNEVEQVVVSAAGKGARPELGELSARLGVRTRELPPREIEALCGSGAHQGVAARAPLPPYADLEDLMEKDGPIVALDGITDPQNLGSIARTAEALGAAGLVIPQDRSAEISAASHKVSAGALEWVPVARVTNLSRALRQLKDGGRWIYGADAGGETDLAAADFDARSVLVIGSEGKGIRPGVDKELDFRVRIALTGKTRSLNAAQASAIIISWMVGRHHGRPHPED